MCVCVGESDRLVFRVADECEMCKRFLLTGNDVEAEEVVGTYKMRSVRATPFVI